MLRNPRDSRGFPPLLPPPLRDPRYPSQKKLSNRPLNGRPRVPRVGSRWVAVPIRQGLAAGPKSSRNQNEAASLIAARGLMNLTGECYRNASLQILLHNPMFLTWIGKHGPSATCTRRDCLVCSFRTVAGVYHDTRPNTQSYRDKLDNRVQLFWDLCQKVFWGPRAQRKRKVGPETLGMGGSEVSFLCWLITIMQEQVSHIPSSLQHLEKLFCREVTKWKECRNPGCGYLSPSADFSPLFIMRHQYQDVSFVTSIQRILNEMHTGEARSPIVETPSQCPDCGTQGMMYAVEKTINLPEILIIAVNRDPNNVDNYLRDIPLEEEVRLPFQPGMSQPYQLSAVQMITTAGLSGPIGHVVSVCQTRDGKIYFYNDQTVTQAVSWREVDDCQRRTNIQDRFLPTAFVYCRKFPPHASVLCKRKSLDGGSTSSRNVKQQHRSSNGDPMDVTFSIADPHFDKLVRDVHEALPRCDTERIIDTLRKYSNNLDETMRDLLAGPVHPEMSLNAVEVGYRRNMLSLYVEFPSNRIQDLYELLRQNKGNLNMTRRKLVDQPQVNMGFVHDIGDARFCTRMYLIPSDKTDPDFNLQRIGGKYTYQLDGRTWVGEYQGKATLA